MPYEFAEESPCWEQLRALDNSFAPAARKALEKIKANPRAGKPLHGDWNYREVRFDPYRITYHIDEPNQKIYLLKLGKRDSVFHR